MSPINGVTTRRVFALGAAGGAFATLLPWQARAAMGSGPRAMLDKAQAVIEDVKHDPQFGNSRELLRECRAVMVIPELVKGGFFVGGEGGDGVVISRTGHGWGAPAFYVIGSASFGLQIGLEVAEMVLFVMSERGLRAFLTDEFKIGAQAGLTVLVVGANAQAATTANARADIIAWAKSKGAYAGITLEGSIIKPRNDWNTEYYGRRVAAAQIVQGGISSSSASAAALRRSLQSG
jgi:lipid-binding SYLF domain-containing protein